MKTIIFNIDGRECKAKEGNTLTVAAGDNDIYIPTLCDFKGMHPVGTCRVCICRINGSFGAACTTIVEEGMIVESDSSEINNLRKAMIEMLFVEGNHQCSICEKSGNCELQALAYKYQLLVPRFPYLFQVRKIKNLTHNMHVDTNRCIQCLRCVRGLKNSHGKAVFKMSRVHKYLELDIISGMENSITDEFVTKASKICPVGAILDKGKGYKTPIGKRRFDHSVIGSDIHKENK